MTEENLKRLACQVVGMLPDDYAQARRVLDHAVKLLSILETSGAINPPDLRTNPTVLAFPAARAADDGDPQDKSNLS